MADFAESVQRFSKDAIARAHATHDAAADLAFESIVHGSMITGAPGQPVAPGDAKNAGELRDSWIKEKISPNATEISTDVEYAEDVELNLRGVHFHNHGPHSLDLTRAGFPAIVAHAASAITRGNP